MNNVDTLAVELLAARVVVVDDPTGPGRTLPVAVVDAGQPGAELLADLIRVAVHDGGLSIAVAWEQPSVWRRVLRLDVEAPRVTFALSLLNVPGGVLASALATSGGVIGVSVAADPRAGGVRDGLRLAPPASGAPTWPTAPTLAGVR